MHFSELYSHKYKLYCLVLDIRHRLVKELLIQDFNLLAGRLRVQLNGPLPIPSRAFVSKAFLYKRKLEQRPCQTYLIHLRAAGLEYGHCLEED